MEHSGAGGKLIREKNKKQKILWHCPFKQKQTFSFLLWNYLQILKMLTKTLFRIPFSVIGQCSPVSTPHWLQWKWAEIYLSQVNFCVILEDHRRLLVSIFKVKIAAIGSLKSFVARNFLLVVNNFIDSTKTFCLDFFVNKESKKNLKSISKYTHKVAMLISSRKLIISRPNPFKLSVSAVYTLTLRQVHPLL